MHVSVEKCFSLIFELVKWNFTTVGPSWKKTSGNPLEKSTIPPPLVKNPSDVCERCDNIISMFIDT